MRRLSLIRFSKWVSGDLCVSRYLSRVTWNKGEKHNQERFLHISSSQKFHPKCFNFMMDTVYAISVLSLSMRRQHMYCKIRYPLWASSYLNQHAHKPLKLNMPKIKSWISYNQIASYYVSYSNECHSITSEILRNRYCPRHLVPNLNLSSFSYSVNLTF